MFSCLNGFCIDLILSTKFFVIQRDLKALGSKNIVPLFSQIEKNPPKIIVFFIQHFSSNKHKECFLKQGKLKTQQG